jgi:hypothetical protein
MSNLDLSTISFNVETRMLDAAVSRVKELKEALAVLNAQRSKGSAAEKTALDIQIKEAKLRKDLATALRAEAMLRKATAKEGTTQVMSTEKIVAVTQKANAVSRDRTTILEKQRLVEQFMTQGLSKGMSSVMASAKIAGAAADELKQLQGVLLNMRKLQGGDPFDQSLSAITAIKNRLDETNESMLQYSRSTGLNAKQSRELSREKDRLIALMQTEGKNADEIVIAIQAMENQYIGYAQNLNRIVAVEKEHERQLRESANAMRYLTAADDKIDSVLATMTQGFNGNKDASERAAEKVAIYGMRLKQAGINGQEAAGKLELYRQKVIQSQKAEEKRKIDYLSRALTPQISDVVVSLGSGMNPFTVLMQQGLQVRDLISSSRVDVKDLQVAFKTAASEMVGSIKGTAIAIGSLLIGAITDAGKAILSIPVNMFKTLGEAVKASFEYVKAGKNDTEALNNAITALRASFSAAIPAMLGFAAVITGALLVAYYKVVSEQSKLSKALAMTGASLGLTKQSALELVDSFEGMNQTKGIAVLTEMAKAGGFTREQFKLVSQAAIELEKYTGVAFEETVKNFSELQKKPTEALLEFAKANGMIEISSIKKVQQLEKEKKYVEAVQMATELYGQALKDVAALTASELHPMELLWIDIKTALSGVWDEIKQLAGTGAVIEPFRKAFEVISIIVSEVWFTIKGVAKEIGGIAAQIGAILSGDFAAAGRISDMMKTDAEAARKAQDAYTASVANGTRYKVADVKVEKDRVKNAREAAGLLRSLKAPKDKKAKESDEDKFYEKSLKEFAKNAVEAQISTLDLTDSYKKFVLVVNDINWDKLTSDQQSKIRADAEEAIGIEMKTNATKMYIDALKKASDLKLDNDYLKEEAKSLGATQGVRQRNSELLKIEFDNKRKVADIQKQLISDADKLLLIEQAKANKEAEVDNLKLKWANDEKSSSLDEIRSLTEENENINFQATLIGKSAEERKRAIEVRKVENELAKELAEIDGIYGTDEKGKVEARVRAFEKASLKMKNFDKQVSNDLAIEMQGKLSDAIETALFEGGDAGKKKLRDLLVEELKKPIRVYIDAIVNGIFGNGSGGGLGSGVSMQDLYSMYSAHSNGGAIGAGASAGSGAALGAYASGNMSAANAAGSIYANATGQGIDGLLATNNAYGTGAGGGGMGAYAGYMTYAALIVAAVMIAENLYEKGYTRAAVGHGEAETGKIGQYSSYTSDPRMGKTNWYEIGIENFTRAIYDMLGVSKKWSDIFSGTTRMGTLFGRKLSGYGMQADINGSDVDVSGYAKYKGGVFRSNKTVKVDIDSRDAEMLKAQIATIRESSRGMAVALGLGTDAIDNYTGSLQVNFKGAKDNAEVAKRYSDAMDKLQMDMLNSIDGFKMTSEEFKKLKEEALALANAAGYSAETMATTIRDGMLGRMSQADVGAALGEQIVGSVYNALAGGFAEQITGMITSQIIQPIMTSILMGGTVSAVVSQTSINAVLEYANRAIESFNQILNDPGIQAMLGRLMEFSTRLAGLVTSPVKNIRTFTSSMRGAGNAAAEAAKKIADEKYALEGKLMDMLGLTERLRQRELSTIHKSNQGLQKHIYALEDAKNAYDKALDSAESALDNAKEAKDNLKEIFDTISDHIKELRNEVKDTAGQSAAAARLFIQETIANNQVPELDKLEDAISTLRDQIENADYVSLVDRNRAMLQLSSDLETLQNNVGINLDKKTEEVKLLEEQIDIAKKTVDELLGIKNNTLSTTEAVDALQLSVTGYQAAIAAGLKAVENAVTSAPSSGGSSSGGGSYGGGGGGSTPAPSTVWTAEGYWSKNQDLHAEYENLIRLDPEMKDPRFNKDSKLSYRDEYLKWHYDTLGIKENRKFKRGGYASPGIAMVGEAGKELVDFQSPARVYTANETEGLLRGSVNSELLAQLVENIVMLRAEMRADVAANSKVSRILDRVSPEGDSLQVRVIV